MFWWCSGMMKNNYVVIFHKHNKYSASKCPLYTTYIINTLLMTFHTKISTINRLLTVKSFPVEKDYVKFRKYKHHKKRWQKIKMCFIKELKNIIIRIEKPFGILSPFYVSLHFIKINRLKLKVMSSSSSSNEGRMSWAVAKYLPIYLCIISIYLSMYEIDRLQQTNNNRFLV